jgi:hypothetical protein
MSVKIASILVWTWRASVLVILLFVTDEVVTARKNHLSYQVLLMGSLGDIQVHGVTCRSR